jgi:hypothetical protein
MSNRWFWRAWHQEYKRHWYVLLALTFFTLIGFGYYHFTGIDNVVQWEKFQEQKVVETTLHEFQSGSFQLAVPANVYILFEYFQGSSLKPNVYVSYAFVLVLAIAFVYLIVVFSALERFWYFASMSLVILFLVSLRLDVLSVFGLDKQWFSIGVIVLYVATSFYINAFRKNTSFQTRVLIFSSITAGIALLIGFFANVPLPFLYLSVTAYVPAILITVLFIIMVAQEIPAGFLYLTSQAQSAKGLYHFLIIMVIYLLNLVLIYAHDMGYVHWDILYINIYLLFTITSVVGLWGWRHREERYGNVMPFYPFGGYFYLALTSIAFSTLAYLKGTANDAPLEALSDILVFCHIGFGFIMLLYVLSNFIGVFEKNLSVWKVLYKPNRMPYETFRLGGLVVVLSFIFYNDWKDYVYNGFSGFWNSMGDLYVEIDRGDVAQTYYEQGRNYGYANQHANYARAYHFASEFQWAKSHEYYERSNVKRPSVYALVNNANVFNWEENYFASIFALQAAAKQMPASPQIMNNLGFMYGKVHALDSALYFLNEARKHSDAKSQAETNFVGIATQELLPLSPDSLAALFDVKNPGVLANAVGLATITHTNFTFEVQPFQLGALTLHQATLLNNYVLNKAYTLSATELEEAEKIAQDSVNGNFAEALKVALAHAHYLQGNVTKALQLMGELSYISESNKGKYSYYIGLWQLEQGNAAAAALAFRAASTHSFKNASLYLAVAETENRNIAEALVLWDSISRNGTDLEKILAFSMKNTLTINLQQALQSTDEVKYQFARYRLNTRSTVEFNALVKSLRDENYKAQMLTEMALRQFDADRLPDANGYLQQALATNPSSPSVKEFVLFAHMQVKAAMGDWSALATLVKEVDFPRSRRLDKLHYEALLNNAAGDKQKAARAFALLAHANPFYEEGIISAAQYIKQTSNDDLKAYTILAEAVQVNNASVRLWKAYISEAVALGLDDYASSGYVELEKQLKK